MTTNYHFSDQFLRDVVARGFADLALSCSDSLPWKTEEEFISTWMSILLGDSAEAKHRLMAERNQRAVERCLEAFETCTKRIAYPSEVTESISHLKSIMPIRPNCAAVVDDEQLIDIDEELSKQDTSDTTMLSCSLPKNFVDQMIQDIDYTHTPPDTSALSMSATDIFTNPCEDHSICFQLENVQDQSAPPPQLPEAQEPQKRSALSYLTRTARTGKAGHPKKEYFRCQHIRAVKKSLRQIEKKKAPKASIHKVNADNEAQTRAWEEMKKIFRMYQKDLQKISDTAVGPTTDGKKRKKEEQRLEDSKSFNNEFCATFFEKEAVRIYNTLFCELVYSCSPEELCKKMKARCCESLTHTAQCEEVWQRVKQFAAEGMLQELGLEALCPPSELSPEDFLRS